MTAVILIAAALVVAAYLLGERNGSRNTAEVLGRKLDAERAKVDRHMAGRRRY